MRQHWNGTTFINTHKKNTAYKLNCSVKSTSFSSHKFNHVLNSRHVQFVYHATSTKTVVLITVEHWIKKCKTTTKIKMPRKFSVFWGERGSQTYVSNFSSGDNSDVDPLLSWRRSADTTRDFDGVFRGWSDNNGMSSQLTSSKQTRISPSKGESLKHYTTIQNLAHYKIL